MSTVQVHQKCTQCPLVNIRCYFLQLISCSVVTMRQFVVVTVGKGHSVKTISLDNDAIVIKSCVKI